MGKGQNEEGVANMGYQKACVSGRAVTHCGRKVPRWISISLVARFLGIFCCDKDGEGVNMSQVWQDMQAGTKL